VFHRLKLRVFHGPQLDADLVARRQKLKIILWSGVAVYPLFLAIAYFVAAETRPLPLILIGLSSSVTCIPVGLVAYARGFGRPLRDLWKERPGEIVWFSFKIGFLYAFMLYWMILGMVEFIFGYHAFRAALISFVASAVARDGFEIGYLRARADGVPIRIFPDGQPLTFGPMPAPLWILAALGLGAGTGLVLGPLLTRPIYQTLTVALLSGGIAASLYLFRMPAKRTFRGFIRFFFWPAMTMGCSYFFILAYLSRMLFTLSPSVDMALLTAACCGWTTADALALSAPPPSTSD
jgi:hypothetical protein